MGVARPGRIGVAPPLVQRHLAMGTRGGVWQIRCEPEGSAARCCAQCDGVEEIGVDEHVW